MNDVPTPIEFAPQVARIDLTPDAVNLIRAASGSKAVAEAYDVTDVDMAREASLELERLSKMEKRLEEVRVSITKPAREIVENTNGFFKPFILALQESQKIIKGRLLTWNAEQQRLADEARRRQEEEARRARQEAEEKAAAARAKAEAEARAAAQRAEEERQRAAKLEAEGKAREAAAAAAAAAKHEQKAANAIETGEAKAQEAALAAAAATVAAPIEAPKVAGFTTRDNWIAERAADCPEDGDAIVKMCAAIAQGRTELVAYLDINWSALNKAAKAQEKRLNVPGITARNSPIAARTARK